LTIAAGHATYINPALAVDEYDNLHAVWISWTYEMEYRKFDGVTWGPVYPLIGSDPRGAPSVVAGPDSCVQVAWAEEMYSGSEMVNEIFYSKFDGTGWGEISKQTGDPRDSQNASIVRCDDGSLYVFWMDSRDGDWEIYWRRIGDFNAGTRLTFSTGESARPHAAVDGDGKIHVIWQDLRDGNREIYYKVRDPGVLSGVEDKAVRPTRPGAVRVTPNPVTVGAEFHFALDRPVPASISVYDVAGRLVWCEDCGSLEPGTHSVRWRGRDSVGKPAASGVYFLRFSAEDSETSTKFVVLR
jgi:hypothetical protein